jgi:translation initiation factor IF-2
MARCSACMYPSTISVSSSSPARSPKPALGPARPTTGKLPTPLPSARGAAPWGGGAAAAPGPAREGPPARGGSRSPCATPCRAAWPAAAAARAALWSLTLRRRGCLPAPPAAPGAGRGPALAAAGGPGASAGAGDGVRAAPAAAAQPSAPWGASLAGQAPPPGWYVSLRGVGGAVGSARGRTRPALPDAPSPAYLCMLKRQGTFLASFGCSAPRSRRSVRGLNLAGVAKEARAGRAHALSPSGKERVGSRHRRGRGTPYAAGRRRAAAAPASARAARVPPPPAAAARPWAPGALRAGRMAPPAARHQARQAAGGRAWRRTALRCAAAAASAARHARGAARATRRAN